MKFRPPRDGSGDRRGNDAAYRLLLARQQRSRGGEGRKVGRKVEVGKKKKEERGNGRKIKAEEEEKKRAPCRVFAACGGVEERGEYFEVEERHGWWWCTRIV